jgi:hypothetical protein
MCQDLLAMYMQVQRVVNAVGGRQAKFTSAISLQKFTILRLQLSRLQKVAVHKDELCSVLGILLLPHMVIK